MDRTELINFLINQRNAKRYLEITMHDAQNNFVKIKCEHKVSSFPKTSDIFFEHNQEQFDVIFIDGVHTEEQTLKDIKNGYTRLDKGGVIVLHDCMPPDAWHQREPEAYKEGENWNGAVWKAVLKAFNNSNYKCTLLDIDWGCGIIDTTLTRLPKCRKLPEIMDYDIHYDYLLEYRKSLTAYLQEQVKVFYHLACMCNWKDVFKEQMVQLKQSGFQQINITVLGTAEDVKTVNGICANLKLEIEIIFWAQELTHFEKPSLIAIEEFAKNNDGYVLYLHSKGVSNPSDEMKVKWRRLMMRELIQNWEQCILNLPHYDLIGVNWRDMPPTSHFCGNFWYASTKYLRKLADFRQYYDNPLYKIWDCIDNKRLGCEFWISSGTESPRMLSLFCRNVDFCNDIFWRDK